MTGDAIIGPVAAPELHVMTFNVRRPMSGPQRSADRWTGRRSLITALLASEQPTLLGTQEVVPEQAMSIGESLGPSYRFVGRGHGPHQRGEGCPVFYDSGRLQLLDWSQTALSDTPDVPGSATWGNRVPRILVSASFLDLRTSAQFLFVNTHLDHLSAGSRVRSAEVIRNHLAARSLPAIVTGDFNASPRSAAYTALFGSGAVMDAWAAASVRSTPEYGTFGGYRAPRPGGRRIDWIAVSPGVHVERIAINTRTVDGRWPSDHLPVHAVVRVPAT